MSSIPWRKPLQKIIAPSILSADFANLEVEVKKMAAAGADWIHVDVMDGHFVPNLTIGAPVVKALKKISPIPLDVHLMIFNLEKYVPEFLSAGADVLTIHVEATKDPKAILKEIRKAGVRSGITLRPGTSEEEILPFLEYSDLVLVMTVEPGFGGQEFRMDQVAKLKRLRKEIETRNLPILLEVDGGVNEKTISFCEDADVIVAGSYIFKNDYQKAIQKLKG
jgi:ribulose-phosphate 3-epimerase